MKKLTGARLLIGGGADDADFRYVTGFHAVDPVVAVNRKGHTVLIVPPMEKNRAEREVRRGVRVIAASQLKLRKSQRSRLSDWILAYARDSKIGQLTVSARCPVGIVERLRRNGLEVKVSLQPMVPQRECKTLSEVKNIASAQRAAVAAWRAAVRYLSECEITRDNFLARDGKVVTAEDVRKVIAWELWKRNCVGEGTIVACGEQSADPHERGSGPLRAHAPIVLDIFPRDLRTGYWGDLTRTVVRGHASRIVRKMYRAVRTAHHKVLRVARAGVSLAKLHELAKAELEAYGFKTVLAERPEGFIHGTGHGVGLEIHEAPQIAPVKGRLRRGHVVTIEPGLYYSGHGGVRIEDTVWITEHGAKVLVRAPYCLEI